MGLLYGFIVVILLSLIYVLFEKEGFRGSSRGIGRGIGRSHGRGYGRGYGRNVYNYNIDYPWYYPWFLYQGMCKKGCGVIGNGSVGCIQPGNNYDECIFASDCYGC